MTTGNTGSFAAGAERLDSRGESKQDDGEIGLIQLNRKYEAGSPVEWDPAFWPAPQRHSHGGVYLDEDRPDGGAAPSGGTIICVGSRRRRRHESGDRGGLRQPPYRTSPLIAADMETSEWRCDPSSRDTSLIEMAPGVDSNSSSMPLASSIPISGVSLWGQENDISIFPVACFITVCLRRFLVVSSPNKHSTVYN